MSYRLFLDDVREPAHVADYMPSMAKEYVSHQWVVVRDYHEFIDAIRELGVPEVISFDHDLAHEHYTPQEYWSDYDASKAYQEAKEYKEATGKDCATWLCEYLDRDNLPLPTCYVHSMNPVGADNIRAVLNSYKKTWGNV